VYCIAQTTTLSRLMVLIAFEQLSAGVVPQELAMHMTPNDWARFHGELTKAQSDGFCKACMVEWACCICFGCVCVFCFHPCIQVSMSASKLDGCARRCNAKHFRNLEAISVAKNGVSINTGAIASVPPLAPQGVVAQVPMQQYQGQPMYIQQGQVTQGQPQYVQQGQVMQGQPMYVQQGQVMQGQPQQMLQGQEQLPAYTEQQPPIAQAITYPDHSTSSIDKNDKYQEEDAPPPPMPSINQQREGRYVVSDPGVLGTTVSIKTENGQVVNIPVPPDCPIGAILTYMY